MKQIRLVSFFFFASVLPSYAAMDPVAWSVDPASNQISASVGNQATATYTLTNRLPHSVLMRTSYQTVLGDDFTIQDDCNGKILLPTGVCQIYVRFEPTRAEKSSFQLTYGYDRNEIPLPVLTATGSGEEVTTALTGTFTQPAPFPSIFYTNQTPFITATFTNTGDTTLTECKQGTSTSSSAFSLTPSSAATLTSDQPITSTCGTTGSTIQLQKGQQCYLYAHLTSLQVTSSVQLDASVNCAETNANAQETFSIESGSGACGTLSITPELPFPTDTYKYADNMVKFKIANDLCANAVPLGTVSLSATTGTATITGTAASPPATYDFCSNQTLAASESCTILASVIPTSTGSLEVQASVTTTAGAQTGSSSTTVASNQTIQHQVLFVNQCPFDVWYGIANKAGAGADPTPGASATTGAPPSSYFLAAQQSSQRPSTIDLAVTEYVNGAFWPRTGCAVQGGQFNCATGTCQTKSNGSTGSGTCVSSGSGPLEPQNPYTKFEATLNATAGTDGVYDVSVINGMSVPVEVKAFGPSVGNTASTVYKCSGAGALLQPSSNNALGNCTWSFNPSSTMTVSGNSDFYWVTPGDDNACSNSATCGMAYAGPPDANGTSPAPINRRNGSFLAYNPLTNDAAYLNADQWGSRNLFSIYGMGIEILGQSASNNYGTTLALTGTSIVLAGNTYPAYNTLLAIPGTSNNGSLNSCYQIGNTFFAHCGGCYNWGNTLPEHQCGLGSPNYTSGDNADWVSNAIPASIGGYTPFQAIEWLKNACPTAYSYQFDDPSSSFTCTQDGSTALMTSYQVTFCPGGLTGLPAGASEGRATAPS